MAGSLCYVRSVTDNENPIAIGKRMKGEDEQAACDKHKTHLGTPGKPGMHGVLARQMGPEEVLCKGSGYEVEYACDCSL